VKRRSKKERWVPDFNDEYLKPKANWEYKGVPPYNGRFWAYSHDNLRKFWEDGVLVHRSTGMPRLMQFADKMPGVPLQNDWQDIPPAPASEALGYPTQKPLTLLRRIIESSSNRGDVVLDPFCGCGTSVQAAAELGRQTIFAPPRITEPCYNRTKIFKLRLTADNGHEIDDWLGTDARDGGRSNVMHRNDRLTDCSSKTRCFLPRIFCPDGIVLVQFHRDGRGHCRKR
jgi:hypothetical protein